MGEDHTYEFKFAVGDQLVSKDPRVPLTAVVEKYGHGVGGFAYQLRIWGPDGKQTAFSGKFFPATETEERFENANNT